MNLELLMDFTQCRQLKCDENKDQRFSGHNQPKTQRFKTTVVYKVIIHGINNLGDC